MPAEFEFSIDYSGTGNFSWSTGTSNPPTQTVTIRHRFLELAFQDYSDFRLRVTLNYENSAIPWLQGSASNMDGDLISPLSLQSIVNFDFLNLSGFSTGTYKVNIIFTIEGFYTNTGNVGDTGWRCLSNEQLTWVLNVQNGNPIKTQKQLYTLYYDKANGSISGDTTVNILNNVDETRLYFEGDGQTLTVADSFIYQFSLLFNDGSLLPASGEYIINAFLRKKVFGILGWTRVWAFQIKIIIIDAPVVVFPTSLYFSVNKNSNEVRVQDLSIINQFGKNVSISKPDWLNISQISVSNSTAIQVSNVEPVNLALGKLTGDVKLSFDDKVITVPVILEVFSFFSHNFDDDYNFCLDQKVITIYQNKENARFVKITATMLFRTPNEVKTLVIPFTIPYYNNRVNLDLGKNIHRYFLKNRTSIFEEPALIYQFDNKVHLYPCQFDLKIEELDIDFKSIYESNITGKKFYPGKRPKLFPFLTNHAYRSRAYDSKHIFSFIAGLVIPEELYDIPVSQNGLEPGVMARAKVERFENKISFGDQKTVTSGGKSITFYQLPDGKNLINVQWENQNLCPEWITMKGVSSQPEELAHIFQDNVFTGLSEKFDTSGTKTITLNTGFILKAEESLIKELMYSKFCILEMDGQFIKAAPSSTKVVTRDTSRQLIEFDLEFKVNGN